jgi:hypothetical protein
MDLLGYVGQKSGDEKYPYQEGALEAQKWNAPPLLLGWLSTPLVISAIV